MPTEQERKQRVLAMMVEMNLMPILGGGQVIMVPDFKSAKGGYNPKLNGSPKYRAQKFH